METTYFDFCWYLILVITILAGFAAIWRPADVVAMNRKVMSPLFYNADEWSKHPGLIRFSGVLAILMGLGMMGLRLLLD